jgi:methenyltetrahydromethanopterin cyclohydrolase
MNNIIESDHGKLKHLIKPTSGFKSMKTAYATIKGFEVMRMFKKGNFSFWKYGQGIFGEIRVITDDLTPTVVKDSILAIGVTKVYHHGFDN